MFIEQRRDEGPKKFLAKCAEVEPRIRHAMAVTDDLLDLTADTLLTDSTLFQTLRNFCGPPISEEDLWTLVGGPKFKRLPAELAEETAAVIAMVLDPVRFPWVEAGRRPTDAERETAVLSTTVLLASRLIGTGRRGDASARQELAVAKALCDVGFTLDPRRDALTVLDALNRQYFSRERKIAEAKCDLPARLADGRLLAIECKVSNGPKNG